MLVAGRPLSQAEVAMVLVHGRGGTAESMLELANELADPKFAYIAPQAANNSWYPLSFLAPLEQNEPALSSALDALSAALARLAEIGIPPERTILLGFSQGACLVLEYAARHAQRYGGVVGLSGGVIGPPGHQWGFSGSLAGTTVFMGCSDIDPHIPRERVLESARVLEGLHAAVTTRIYPGMGHTVNQDELDFVKSLMAALAARTPQAA